MRHLRSALTLALLVAEALLSTSCSSSTDSSSAASPGSCVAEANGYTLRLDSGKLHDALVASAGASGVVGLAAEVRLPCGSWRDATGIDDIATGSPLHADGAFRIGSITKSLVATVVLQLVSEGRMQLEDAIERWYAGYPNGSNITVRQILSHTSGVPNYASAPAMATVLADDPLHVFTPEELVGYAATLPATFPPGTSFAYSNTNYILAGLIIEAVTNDSAAHQIRTRILAPLHVEDTWLDPDEPAVLPLVHGYEHFGSDGARDPNAPPTDVTYALSPTIGGLAAAYVSTSSDVATFFEGLLSGRVLTAEMLDAMKPAPNAPRLTGEGADLGAYGLGLIRLDTGIGVAYGHEGNFLGNLAYAVYFPEPQLSVVVLFDDHKTLLDLSETVARILATML